MSSGVIIRYTFRAVNWQIIWIEVKMEIKEYQQIKSFGSLVREKRNQMRKDLKNFGSYVNVDPSSISRLESEGTEATLISAIRICEALGITPANLIKELFGNEAEDIFLKDEQSFLKGGKALTKEDLDYLMAAFDQNKLEVLGWLAALLNRIIYSREAPSNDFSSELQDLYSYNASDIFKLLEDNPVYKAQLQYPLNLDPEKILGTFANGGVITFQDVGVFLKNIRSGKNITLAELGNKSKISESMLSKFEAGSIKKVKLQDIMIFDNILGQDGKLLTLYWHISKISDNNPPTEEPRLITIFIILFRWFQHLGLDDQNDFIEKVRNDFAQLGNTTGQAAS